MAPKEPIISLTQLLQIFGNLLASQQEQHQAAVLYAKESIDSLTRSLLAAHHFPLSPRWTVEELTAQVIDDENLQTLPQLIDTVREEKRLKSRKEYARPIGFRGSLSQLIDLLACTLKKSKSRIRIEKESP